MVVSRWTAATGSWKEPRCEKYRELDIEPAAGVINYGFSIIEGLKAFRSEAGDIKLFRARQNAERALEGAVRLAMPPVGVDMFVQAAKACVEANARFVPPCGRGALYLRPLLFASGTVLSGPSDEFTFVIYSSPVGSYFKGREVDAAGIRMLACNSFSRSVVGGVGHVKAGGNYAPTFLPKHVATARGCDEVLYLDSRGNNYLEEASSSNIFIVTGKQLRTPWTTNKTILDGVTRDTIIQIGRAVLGLEVVADQPVTLDMLRSADEAFCVGTGAGVTPVRSVLMEGSTGSEGPEVIFRSSTVGSKLAQVLEDIQYSRRAPLGDDWLLSVTDHKVALLEN